MLDHFGVMKPYEPHHHPQFGRLGDRQGQNHIVPNEQKMLPSMPKFSSPMAQNVISTPSERPESMRMSIIK